MLSQDRLDGEPPRGLAGTASAGRPAGTGARIWLPATGLILGIFAVDTLIPLEFAVAVLYVVIVPIVAMSLDRAQVLIAAAGCAALTILSWLLVHRLMFPDTATLRTAMSLSAIAITTLLALRNISIAERLATTQRQRANLARFFPPQLVDELAELDRPLSLIRNRPAAVLFADMVGSTAHCSRMPPEAVIALLRDLQAILSGCVFAKDGIVDKFLGDGLIGVFGLPVAGAGDAGNAARCGLAILDEVDRWNRDRLIGGEEPVRVVVGIHHGPVVQGDIGNANRLELTVVGDTVNIASRVEAYCRTLGADLLVTGPFIAALRCEGSLHLAARFADLGQHRLRGRAAPIRLYGIRRTSPDATARQPATPVPRWAPGSAAIPGPRP